MEKTGRNPMTNTLSDAGGSGVRLQDGGGEAAWIAEPRILRMAHGIPDRVHRIKALGNAVSPPLIRVIGEIVMKADEYFRS